VQLLTWSLIAVNWRQIEAGSGQYDIAHGKNDPAVKHGNRTAVVWFTYQIIYPLVPALVKLSILRFYLSFATGRTLRFLVYATMAFVAAETISIVLITIFECPKHPSLAWSRHIFSRRKRYGCLPIKKLYYGQASMNIFSDIVVFALPLPVLMKLRMETHRRIGLLLLFSVGLLVPVASAFRLHAVHLWVKAAWAEQRYYGGYLIFWDHVEANTAIICASVPSLQPLFRGCFGRVRHYAGRSYEYYSEEGTTTIGRRVSRRVERGLSLDGPMPTYRRASKGDDGIVESGVVLIKEINEEDAAEEELRSRVRAFAVRPTSSNSQPPKSPARPRDILAGE
jgi:hypothetical protein